MLKMWKQFIVVGSYLVMISNAVASGAQPNDQINPALDGTSQHTHDWLEQSGFRAVIGSYEQKSFIYVESTPSGLVFRACARREVQGLDKGMGGGGDSRMSQVDSDDPTTCPTILNNESMAIPADVLMKQSLGFTRLLEVVGEVGLEGALIVAGNMGTTFAFTKGVNFSILAVAAKSSTVANPANIIRPVTSLNLAEKTSSKLLQYGDRSDDLQDHQIVTVLLDKPYSEILAGISEELTAIVKRELKRDQSATSLGRTWEEDYHTEMNNELKPGSSTPESQPASGAESQPPRGTPPSELSPTSNK